jgi:hypothetical protein
MTAATPGGGAHGAGPAPTTSDRDAVDKDLRAGRIGGRFPRYGGLFGGRRIFDANPRASTRSPTGRLWHRESFSHQYPALLALPQPGDLSRRRSGSSICWSAAGDRAAAGKTCGRPRSTRSTRRGVGPGMGHDRIPTWSEPPPLVHRASVWGVRSQPWTARCGERSSRRARREAAAVFSKRRRMMRGRPRVPPRRLTCSRCGGTAFDREMNILDAWSSTRIRATGDLSQGRSHVAGRRVSGRERSSIAAGSRTR